MKTKIMLDTNFVMLPAQLNVDIYSEIDRIMKTKYELCVLDKTINELNSIIEKQKGKHRDAAKLALSLLKAKNIKIEAYDSEKYVDDCLVELAEKGYLIATHDKELKLRIKEKNKNLIFLRQKKYLELL